MAPEPFLKAMMGVERIRTLGNAWQHAIGNVIAAPGTERRTPRSTIRGVATSYSTRGGLSLCAWKQAKST
jgi:hypothetical protein